MSGNGGTFKRCACTADDGKPVGKDCPKLPGRHHGSWFWAAYLDTSKGRKLVKRGGFALQRDAESALEHVRQLVALAGADDRTRRGIGDMVTAKTLRGGQLDAVDDVRRRLGIGGAPGDPGITFGEAWPVWLAGKKKLRASARERWHQIGEHWLLPVLADVPLERLNAAHCQEVFTRIEAINAELGRQRGDGRAWVHVDGDVRKCPKLVGIASQHRVYGALRTFLNYEVKKTRRIPFNPIFAIELDEEPESEQASWTAAQAAEFLGHVEGIGDPLALLFRIVLLRGARRGEACGYRWSTSDLDGTAKGAPYLSVDRPILLIGGTLTEGTPKTSGSERLTWLDAATVKMLRAHRTEQAKARLRAGSAWQDDDLIFCQADGTPYRPDYVYRRFIRLAKDAGLPVIRLHDGRHTAVSIMDAAGIDRSVRMAEVGHVTEQMHDRYTHVDAARHQAAAELVAALVDKVAGQ
jgi:integrase